MQCPNCQSINSPEARFCQNCGEKLVSVCPNCGTRNQVSANFCQNCGRRLEHNPSGGKTLESTPVKKTPGNLEPSVPAQQFTKQENKLASERRIVTVLFADVVGSTSLAEKMDPEDWSAVMNGAFDLFNPVIYQYGGIVTRLLGDALLAIFGAPVAHEDDPQRAIRAALEILSKVENYASEIRKKYPGEVESDGSHPIQKEPVEFAIRIGINTGLVVTGDLGNDMAHMYTAMGDAVNIAARLQSLAEPMSVLVSGDTYHWIRALFEVIDLGEVDVKGKKDRINVYRIVAPKSVSGIQRGIMGFESPMVGRNDELAALLELSRAIRAGIGRAAVVVGDAGLGKSRLVLEWKNALAASDKDSAKLTPGGDKSEYFWVEGGCLSYGRGLAHHLIIDMLFSLLRLSSRDDPASLSSSLAAFVEKFLGEKSVHVIPYLSHFLSLPMDEQYAEQLRGMDAAQIQFQVIDSLKLLLSVISNRQPMILVIEDLHWADASSVDFLLKLIPVIREAPILFCFLTRPDIHSEGWKVVTTMREQLGYSLLELNLEPLSEFESKQLLANLLKIEALPEDVRSMILQRTEGNPFYVEEVIRSFLDQSVIVRKNGRWEVQEEINWDEIPANLQTLLLARIDRLPEESRRILKIASVIGKMFPVTVLERVIDALETT